MNVKLEDNVVLHLGTTGPTTGAAADADSTPTVTVEEDGVALGYSPTVVNVATGLYRVTINCTTANGFEAGKRYSVYVLATVSGVSGRDSLAEFQLDARTVDELATPADVASALTAYDPPTKAEMDAAFAALNDISVADILAGIIDGSWDVGDTLKEVLAYVSGNVAKIGDAYTYKDKSGTGLFTNTITLNARTRS